MVGNQFWRQLVPCLFLPTATQSLPLAVDKVPLAVDEVGNVHQLPWQGPLFGLALVLLAWLAWILLLHLLLPLYLRILPFGLFQTVTMFAIVLSGDLPTRIAVVHASYGLLPLGS